MNTFWEIREVFVDVYNRNKYYDTWTYGNEYIY